ncbi:Chromosome segregation ATPase [Giardia duodenalis]|uniref:Chromosome segregation ATPase n=1 Tax=Giardia intestinalis TaxID=5741 RepID=V6TR00_GIAIN|nr:Chromosome segregation ATPase [Giardia intestinalis]
MGNKMDGQAFAMEYQSVADIYSTNVHGITSAQSTVDPSSRIALFTCSYGMFDEANQATFRKRMGEYREFNNSSTKVQQSLLSPYLARLSHYSNDDASALLTMGIPYGVNTLYDVMMAKFRAYQSFTEEEVWRVVAALCDAARFVHSEEKPDTELEEFAHLGIHPANIFLYADDAHIRLGYPYACPVTSFKNPDNYRAYQQLGEAHFMAPEFVEAGSKGSCPCDIFSIGMIGYTMMMSSTAWSSTNGEDLQREIYTRGAIQVQFDGRYSQDLVDLINSMLSFDSSARPRAVDLCTRGRIAQYIADNGDAPTIAPVMMTREVAQPPSGPDLMAAAKAGDLDGVRSNMHQAGCTNDSPIISSTLSHCSLHTGESSLQPYVKYVAHNDDISNISSNINQDTHHQFLLPPTNDYVFAKLFGSDENVLKCLLNAILDGKPYVKHVTLGPTEYKKTTPDGKSVRLDIKATINDGTIVDVEMQCINTGDIYHRSIYYQSLILRDYTIKQGQSYKSIPDVIIIWIMNQDITNRKGCMHEIVPMYKANGIDQIEIASEKMRQFIIELTKLGNTSNFCYNKAFTAWMTFIKDPSSISGELLEVEGVQTAMEELTYLSKNKETRAIYDARRIALLDLNSAIEHGIEKGKAEGEKNARMKMIINMLSKGLNIENVKKWLVNKTSVGKSIC